MEKYILKEYGQGTITVEFWLYMEHGDDFFKMVRVKCATVQELLRLQKRYNRAVIWINQNPINLDELPKFGLRWIAAHQPLIRIYGRSNTGIKVQGTIITTDFRKKYKNCLSAEILESSKFGIAFQDK